jgi:serine protease Do
MTAPLLFKVAIVLICQALLACQASAQENLPALVEKIKPAILTILTYDAGGNPKGQGSGFIISEIGQFITTCHVLAGACRIEVKTSDGQRYTVDAAVVEEPLWDLALGAIKPPGKGLSSLKLSDGIPDAGQRVLVIGSRIDHEHTAIEGVVSAIRNISGFGKILELSAPLAPGFSGSPVVNLKGEVVGIAMLQLTSNPNIGFAIPGDRALALQQRQLNKPAASPAIEKRSSQEPPRPRP